MKDIGSKEGEGQAEAEVTILSMPGHKKKILSERTISVPARFLREVIVGAVIDSN